MTENLAIAAIAALLGGGLLTGAANVYRARADARANPAQRDSIIVTSAESAVSTLKGSLEAETHRADRAEARVLELAAEIDRQQKRIERLESRLDALQVSLTEAREELHRIINTA